MLDVSRDEITDGPISRALLLLAAPLVAQNVVQFTQLIVDTFWLGRVGETAVAGVGLVFPATSVLSALVLLPFVGTQVVVSQRTGAGSDATARRASFNGVLLALVVTVPATIVFYFGARPIIGGVVSALNPGTAVVVPAATYLAVYALATPIYGVSDVIEGSFVGVGDSRAALYVTLLVSVTNFALDPILIFGFDPLGIPAMGVAGAAWATVAGFAAGLALVVAFALGGRDTFGFTRSSLRVDFDDWRELVAVGIPSTGQRLAQDAVRLVLVGVVLAVGGAAGLAAYTIGARVSAMAWIPSGGLQQATQSVVGQNLGAGKPERARRTTWTGVRIVVAVFAVLGAIQFVLPASFARLFVPHISGDALTYTVAYLQILALGYWAIGVTYVVRGGFNGARRTQTSMLSSMAQYWLVRLPVALGGVVLLSMNVTAVFWAVTISNVVAAVGLAGYYRYTARSGMNERASERAMESAAN